jgi:hypothetical protein
MYIAWFRVFHNDIDKQQLGVPIKQRREVYLGGDVSANQQKCSLKAMEDMPASKSKWTPAYSVDEP